MTYNLTAWLQGTPRSPAVSPHFTVIDGEEASHDAEELLTDLARRVIDAKTSRDYLAKYGPVLGWDFVTQRLAAGPQRVRRGDFGEVVACGWLEDYTGLIVPVKKLRSQINPGQTLPSTDAVAFQLQDGVITKAHFLEAKLRTKNVMITSVAMQAYNQLVSDRALSFREILQFVHEQMYRAEHPLLDSLTDYLKRQTPADDDSHEIVVLIERDVWTDDILIELDAIAGTLSNCSVHGLRVSNLADLIDQTYARANMELIDDTEEE